MKNKSYVVHKSTDKQSTCSASKNGKDIKPNLTPNSSLTMQILSSSGKTDWRNADQAFYILHEYLVMIIRDNRNGVHY